MWFIPVIKADFIIITPVISVTWPFRNHWWSRHIYDYHQGNHNAVFVVFDEQKV